MDHADHVREAVAWAADEGRLGSFRGSPAQELRDGLTPRCRGPPNLVVEFGVESKAPHGFSVLHQRPSRYGPTTLGEVPPPPGEERRELGEAALAPCGRSLPRREHGTGSASDRGAPDLAVEPLARLG